MHKIKYILGIIGFLFISCSVTKYLPQESIERGYSEVRDTIYVEVRDSVVYYPESIYKTYGGLLDTAVVDSPNFEAKAYVDTLYSLVVLDAKDKPKMPQKTKIEYRYRTIERTDTLYIEKKIPYEVEVVKNKVPKWCWWLLGMDIVAVLLVIVRIWLKMRK